MDPNKIFLYYAGFFSLLITFIMMDKRQQILVLVATCFFGAANGVTLKVGSFKFDFGGSQDSNNKETVVKNDLNTLQDEDASTGTVVFNVKDFEESSNEAQALSDPESEISTSIPEQMDCSCPDPEPVVVEKVVSTCNVALAEQLVALEKEKSESEEKLKEFIVEYIETLDQLEKADLLTNMQNMILQKMPVYYQQKVAEVNAVVEENIKKYEAEVDQLKSDFKDQKSSMMQRHNKKEKERSEYINKRDREQYETLKSTQQKYDLQIEKQNNDHFAEILAFRRTIRNIRESHKDVLASRIEDHEIELRKLKEEHKVVKTDLETQITEQRQEHEIELSRIRREFSNKSEKESNYNTNKITSLIEKFEAEKEKLKETYEKKMSKLESEFLDDEIRIHEELDKERAWHKYEISDLLGTLNKTEALWAEKLTNRTKFYQEELKTNREELVTHYSAIISDLEEDTDMLNTELKDLNSDLADCDKDLIFFRNLHGTQQFCNSTLIRSYAESEFHRLNTKIYEKFHVILKECGIFSSKVMLSIYEKVTPILVPYIQIGKESYERSLEPHIHEIIMKVSPYLDQVQEAVSPFSEPFIGKVQGYASSYIGSSSLISAKYGMGGLLVFVLVCRQRRKSRKTYAERDVETNVEPLNHISGLDGWKEATEKEQ